MEIKPRRAPRDSNWGEREARAELTDLASSGQSMAAFAASRGYSIERLAYWKRRLAQIPEFVAVSLPSSTRATASGQIEIAVDGIVVRVREDLDVDRIARLVDSLSRRGRRC